MEHPLLMVRSAWPESVPVHSRARESCVTTRTSPTVSFAAWMLPPRLRNWLVPPLLPTTETLPMTSPTPARQRQVPPTSSTSTVAYWLPIVLFLLGLVALGMLVVFFLVYKKATGLLKWACAEESSECNKPQSKPAEKTTKPRQSGKCVLPAYPENGIYVINNTQGAVPGERFDTVKLTFLCLPGFRVLGNEEALCQAGIWYASVPKCVRFCELTEHPSVHYQCLVNGSTPRNCNRYEPSGTVVKPKCNSPNYYSSVALPFMRCIEGSWDYVAVCSPECGRVTSDGVGLMLDGRSAKPAEFPWHVGVYRNSYKPYKQICGGSIVTNRLVISAAHCFWGDVEKQQPASNYAVAAGKIYRPWNEEHDFYAQKSDVKEIHLPPRFQGNAANFQDDIALVILVTPFVYHPYVRPICLDFDPKFDKRQLQPGNMGRVAGWGLKTANGEPSMVLKALEVPYVDTKECIESCAPNFKAYITSDKMCAGFGNGTGVLCRGDSGGGLVFPESERGTERYYLRGIVSTSPAPNNNDRCNTHSLTTFTQILIHQHFVMEYL